MRKKTISFSRLEKILLACFGVLFFWAIFGAASYFYQESTQPVPSKGGVYREGMVGDVSNLVLNPVFVYGKRDRSIEADISALLFAGLMKFDSKEGKLQDYIATHTLTADKKTYTFKLNEGLRWHDGVDVTIEDVLFTYRDVIQHEDFSNEALKKAFEDVVIEKISDDEITFTISYPYKFFITNFIVGILPKHILENTPVSEMEYSQFSAQPIGNGPFSYDSLDEVRRNVFQLRMEAFHGSSAFDPYLEAVEFDIYPSKNALSLDSDKLTGVRPFPQAYESSFSLSPDLEEKTFSLPQYSALFFNMKQKVFDAEKGRKVRLALQLATDKDSLLSLVPAVRIDTPLLETKSDEWLYEFDLEKANGALKDAGYFLPSSKPKTFVPEGGDTKWIQSPSSENVWEGNKSDFAESSFAIAGEYPLKIQSVKVLLNNEEIISEQKPELARNWKFEIPFSERFIDGTHEVEIQFIGFDGTVTEKDALSFYLEPESAEESIEDVKYEIREDKDGNPLRLTLITTENPYYYQDVAEYLQDDFGKIGVDLEIKVLNMQSFLDSVRHREYDILLYGQNLGYNLDIYEFFHESQVGNDNVSDYQNPEASVLIEEIRSSHVQEVRDRKLQELREVLKNDIPAVFLFSPRYQYYFDPNMEGLAIQFIAFYKDRFSHIDKAYVRKQRSFVTNSSWYDFPGWFTKNFMSFITYSL